VKDCREEGGKTEKSEKKEDKEKMKLQGSDAGAGRQHAYLPGLCRCAEKSRERESERARERERERTRERERERGRERIVKLICGREIFKDARKNCNEVRGENGKKKENG